MRVLHLFVGKNKSPDHYQEHFEETAVRDGHHIERKWPEKEHSSAYLKDEVTHIRVTLQDGIIGNEIGFPTHIANAAFRTALVINTGVYQDFELALPGSSVNMKPGCFGENITVDDPSLHPREVCIGDVFRVGSVVFEVTGPRMPCPKVDAFLGANGVTALGRKTSWTGYFVRVIEEGECSVDDSFELVDRPYPGLTMTVIQQSLWGDVAQQNHSEDFLSTISQIDCLIPRHYRETALQRLERCREA